MIELIPPGLIAALIIAALHWAPWNKILGRELQPPWTYVVGLLPLMLTFTGWALIEKPTHTHAVVGLWAIVGAGGIADGAAYLVDDLAGARIARKLVLSGRSHGENDHPDRE